MPPVVFDPGEWTPEAPADNQSWGMMDATGMVYPAPGRTLAPTIFDPNEWTPEPKAPETWGDTVNKWSLPGLDYSFGIGDEIVGYEKGLHSLMKGGDFWPIAEAETTRIRQAQKQLAAEEPWKYAAAGIASQIPTVAAQALFSAPVAAARAIPTLGQKLAAAMGTGAAYGGAYGFGSGEGGLGNRLTTGAVGAGTGAVAGPVLQLAASGTGAAGKAMLNSRLGSSLMDYQGALNAVPEAGMAAYGGGSVRAPALTTADKMLARKLAGLAPEQVQTAQTELVKALNERSPLFLAEAAAPEGLAVSPEVARLGRVVANSPGGMEFGQQQIRQRTEGATSRLGQILNEVSSEGNPLPAAQRFTEGINQIIADATQKRKEATQGVYQAAFKAHPIIKGTEIAEVIADPQMQATFAKIRANPRFVKLYGDVPDNSLALLHEARQALNKDVKNIAQKSSYEADQARAVIKELDSVLETQAPGYLIAKDMFKEASRLVNRLEGNDWGKRSYGLLENLMGGDPEKAVTAARRLMEMQPETIRKIRGIFGTKYREEFRAGVRAMVEEDAQKHPIADVTKKWLLKGSQKQRQLEAALGSKDFESLAAKLQREHKIFEGGRKYYEGSTTAGNLAEAADNNMAAKALRGVAQTIAHPRESLERGINSAIDLVTAPWSTPDPTVSRRLAEALFTTRGGKETLEKIMPLINRNRAINKGVEAVTSSAVKAARRGASESAWATMNKPKQEAKPGASLSKALDNAKAEAKTMPAKTPDKEKLLNAVEQVESKGDVKAVSKKGAQGAFQFMPETGKAYHKRLGLKEPYDPKNKEQQKKLASAYLDDLFKRYEDPRVAIAAYNLGETKMNAAIPSKSAKWEDVINLLPEETQEYVPKILKLLG